MKEKVITLLAKATNLNEKELANLVEIPPNSELGDYAFPCFILSKKLKKNPSEIASELAKKIPISEDIERIESSGPYINFFVNSETLAKNALNDIMEKKDKYGSQNLSQEKVMIEYSQANTHKAFHIGHVRGTALGESIAKILEFCGNKTIRANYQGDTGMHVAKWIWCYKKYHPKEKLKKDESWIAGIYVEAVNKLAENAELQQEVDEINKKLDSKKDKKLNALWKATRKLSLDSLEPIYEELNTKFNYHFFESEMESRAKEIVKELVKKRIAKKSDEAIIVDLEKHNLGVWVLLRKDGTVLYSAKDLALAEKKFKKYKIDKSIYVVGSAQNLHFYQLFKTLELMKFKQAKKCLYVPVTEIRLPEGKMSSRTGNNILYSSFKKELLEYAKSEIKNRETLPETDLNKRAQAIAITNLKYALLKQDVNKAIVFNKEEAMHFEGNTGSYLLYTYARARSILRKANYIPNLKYLIEDISNYEKKLLLQLSNFPEIVLSAYNNLSPNLIANYSYNLSQIFNEFYHNEKVIGSDNEAFKLTLVHVFSQVLKNALSLLNIQALEQM